ncbi:hypothetical protein HYS48_04535 [Candidatus Woesearchaeota archaeon]|nr:hypothetical protein [Candidatus Woesearchaeota archaeon]
MDERDRILQIVRMRGPVLPSQISKELNTNILFASAMLSELVDNKQLRLSNTKVGGSPVYYVDGQEFRLQELYQKLHEKERKAFDLLKQKRVLQDTALEPVIRAALREIKDFAKPLEVNYNGKAEIFWKWYLLKNEEAAELIKQQLGAKQEQEVRREQFLEQPKHAMQQPVRRELKQERLEAKPEMRKEAKEEEDFMDRSAGDDKFLRKVKRYFEKNTINVVGLRVIRKNAEVEGMVEIPSPVGTLSYFFKAKNKQKCNDGDLSSAFIQGQSKKLPILFLTAGSLSKKARELLQTEFKNMVVKEL